jgi:hypothetical protein
MRREKVISNYYRLRDSELATMAGKVLGALEGNGHFTDLTPPLPELKVLIEDYQTKHEVASRGGSVLEVSLKNESRETLLNALRILAHHVNMVADGRLTLLNSTGLILAKQPTRVNIPGVIERLTLKDAALTGQVRLDFTRIKEAWEYEITVGGLDIDGKLEWIQTHSSTNSKGIVLSPFESGSRVYIRVRACNGRGCGDWSEHASTIVK